MPNRSPTAPTEQLDRLRRLDHHLAGFHRYLLAIGRPGDASAVTTQRDMVADLIEGVALDRLVAAMDEAPDWASFRPLDQSFHLALADLAGSAPAEEELTRVLGAIGRLYFPHPVDYLRESNNDHRAMVDALGARDLASAVAAVERHVLNNLRRDDMAHRG